MNNYKKKISQWTQADKDRFIQEGKDINQALISAINNQLKPASPEVQVIIHRHHAWVAGTQTRKGILG